MQKDLTHGSITKSMLLFAAPMILGNLLQQLYNIVDTLIVGRYLGPDALAAVGSSFALMGFLTSVILGLCMGSGVLFSMLFGAREEERLKTAVFLSFLFIGGAALIINVLVLVFLDPMLRAFHIPQGIFQQTREYMVVIY